MTQSQYERLFNATSALIEGLRPHATRDLTGEIAEIIAAIEPTYEYVRSGRNPSEIEELINLFDDMNKIASRYKTVETIMSRFGLIYDAAPDNSLRMILIKMILFHPLFAHEQDVKKYNIEKEQLAREAAEKRDAYDNSPEQVAQRMQDRVEYLRRQAAASAADAAASAAAEEEEYRQSLIALYNEEIANRMIGAQKWEQKQLQRRSAKGGKKSGKKSGKKGGKKSHKKSHKRRH